MNTNSKLIGIGASAGGLKAIQAFFDNVPNDTRHSFVVIQHLSLNHQNMMNTLLKSYTILPIQIVEHDLEIEPGHIYLIPATHNLTVEDNHLKLEDRDQDNPLNLPIDLFFTSLAEAKGEKAIAIILSGTGSDGTKGIRKIKDKNGFVAVQDPNEAEFDGMPLSAIGTNLVDQILSVGEMPEVIFNYISSATTLILSDEGAQSYIKRILLHIKNVKEINFEDYKLPTILRAIDRRIKLLRKKTLKGYFEYILHQPEEVDLLFRSFLINVTSFFRDIDTWNTLKTNYLPELIRKKSEKNEILKVWSVGCSTGEEVYTLAILINEVMQEHKINCEVKIFGTDAFLSNIEFAKKGEYPVSLVADMPSEYLVKYFFQKESSFRVKPFIRNKIVFTTHNILSDFPFYKVDLLSCRNLLIYLKPKVQGKIISIFNNAMNLEGILLLGSSETVDKKAALFSILDRKMKIYKNVKKGKRSYVVSEFNYPNRKVSLRSNKELSLNKELKQATREHLVAELNAVSFVIDKGFQILSSVGNIKDFLILPTLEFTNNLTKLLPKSIGLLISSSIRSLIQREKDTLQYYDILYQSDKTRTYYNITVSVLELPYNDHDNSNSHFIVLFTPSKLKESENTLLNKAEQVSIVRLEELENELNLTKKNLEHLVRELEINNEELQTTNEELLATNEELQSSNEELQSVNEELHTVNAEYQQKLLEIENLNSDMDNLLRSTKIGTIFLDSDKCLRKFTPAAREQFNLRQSDLGRPLSHLTGNFSAEYDRKSLNSLLDDAIDDSKSSQQEINTINDKIYIQRINPFLSIDGKAMGAVISYIDVTNVRLLREKLEDSKEKLKLVEKHTKSTIVMLKLDGEVLYINKENSAFYKSTSIGSYLYDHLPSEAWKEIKTNIAKSKESGSHIEYQNLVVSPSGTPIHYLHIMSPVFLNKKITAVVILSTDISELKLAQQELILKNTELKRKNSELSEFTYIASHDLREPITTFQGLLNMLQNELSSSDNKLVDKLVTSSWDTINVMESIVNSLLLISKIGSEEKVDNIDLNQIVLQVLEELKLLIKETKAELIVPKLPIIRGYPLGIKMVFSQLISNALKFRQKDIKPIIEVIVDSEEDYWKFEVKDNGIGIPQQYQDRVFQIFQRLVTKEEAAGNGTGLSLCKKYVEIHGGKIWLSSEEGKGSSFYFTIKK